MALFCGGANLSYSLLNIVLGLGLTIGLFLLLQKTKLGLAIRTTASIEKTARLMGVPTKWVTLFAWALALVLGTLSGAMIAPSTSVTVNLMDSVQVNAFIACVLGGFQTFYGPVIGAYIIAIATNLLSYYVSSVWGTQILYILLLYSLYLNLGLIGKKTVKKYRRKQNMQKVDTKIVFEKSLSSVHNFWYYYFFIASFGKCRNIKDIMGRYYRRNDYLCNCCIRD